MKRIVYILCLFSFVACTKSSNFTGVSHVLYPSRIIDMKKDLISKSNKKDKLNNIKNLNPENNKYKTNISEKDKSEVVKNENGTEKQKDDKSEVTEPKLESQNSQDIEENTIPEEDEQEESQQTEPSSQSEEPKPEPKEEKKPEEPEPEQSESSPQVEEPQPEPKEEPKKEIYRVDELGNSGMEFETAEEANAWGMSHLQDEKLAEELMDRGYTGFTVIALFWSDGDVHSYSLDWEK